MALLCCNKIIPLCCCVRQIRSNPPLLTLQLPCQRPSPLAYCPSFQQLSPLPLRCQLPIRPPDPRLLVTLLLRTNSNSLPPSHLPVRPNRRPPLNLLTRPFLPPLP